MKQSLEIYKRAYILANEREPEIKKVSTKIYSIDGDEFTDSELRDATNSLLQTALINKGHAQPMFVSPTQDHYKKASFMQSTTNWHTLSTDEERCSSDIVSNYMCGEKVHRDCIKVVEAFVQKNHQTISYEG